MTRTDDTPDACADPDARCGLASGRAHTAHAADFPGRASLPGKARAADARPSAPASGGGMGRLRRAGTLACTFALALCLALCGCATEAPAPAAPSGQAAVSIQSVPAYDGTLCIEVNGGKPGFSQEDIDEGRARSFERYSTLDNLERCGVAFARVGLDTMPDKERGDISEIHPSGWEQELYDFVDQEALYNRSHLIAHQLAGEDANERNLITGTRTMNSEGMIVFEEAVGDYVRETGNHVLYRVTPLFCEDELVARGVQMEALSLEDDGEGICFNVFVYNVEPGVAIDYATGESRESDDVPPVGEFIELDAELPNTTDAERIGESGEGNAGGKAEDADGEANAAGALDEAEYVLNTGSMTFHDPSCPSVADIAQHNRQDYEGSRDELISRGFDPCGGCRP